MDLSKLTLIEARWTGVSLEQIRLSAEKSYNQSTSGVVVIAVDGDTQKVDVLMEGIRRGLINHLILDQTLADRLEEKLYE